MSEAPTAKFMNIHALSGSHSLLQSFLSLIILLSLINSFTLRRISRSKSRGTNFTDVLGLAALIYCRRRAAFSVVLLVKGALRGLILAEQGLGYE